MASKTQQVISSFDGGVVSPQFYASVDAQKFGRSLRESYNWMILPTGAGLMRPGFENVIQCKATQPSNTKRLIPFAVGEFDWLIELGHFYLRVIVDGAVAADIVTPWGASKINDLNYAQKRGRMYFVHPDYTPHVLIYDNDSWTFKEQLPATYPQYDFDDSNSPDPTDQVNTIAFFGASAGQQYRLKYGGFSTELLTFSSTILTNITRISRALARLPSINQSTTVACVYRPEGDYEVTISGPDAGKGLIDAIGVDMPDPEVTEQEAGGGRFENAWSGERGWPRAVTWFQSRLVYAGSRSLPEFVWFSGIGDEYHFSTEEAIYDADPVELSIDDSEQIVIRWVRGKSQVILGSSNGHFAIGAQGPLTPTNWQIDDVTSYRSSGIQPAIVNSEIIYVDEGRAKLRNLLFSEERQSSISYDLTNHISHLTKSSLSQPFKSTRPETFVWTHNDQGDLLLLTYSIEANQAAWSRHRHRKGGIEAACVVREQGTDSIYIVVTYAGERWIEKMRPNIQTTGEGELYGWSDLPYLDACVHQVTPDLTTTVTGLDHLEGQTVQVTIAETETGNAAVHPDVVVSGGTITTQWPGRRITVGQRYDNEIITQALAQGSPRGYALGQKQRWNRVFLNLNESVYPTVNGSITADRDPQTPMNTPEPVVTEPVEYRQDDGWDEEGTLTIVNPHPLPCCVAGLYGEFTVAS